MVENRPGGDGFVAITAFTSAKDDHVFLWGPAAAFTAHPYLHEKLPYDPNDISPVARITTTIVSMSVPTGLNINSMKDLIARAKAEPGQLTWATVTGATDFVFAGWLKMDGLDMLKVPYRDPVTALNDLSENRIQVFNSAYAIVRAQADAGRVKVLAVTNRERFAECARKVYRYLASTARAISPTISARGSPPISRRSRPTRRSAPASSRPARASSPGRPPSLRPRSPSSAGALRPRPRLWA